MKKIISLILLLVSVLALSLSLVGCANNTDTPAATDASTQLQLINEMFEFTVPTQTVTTTTQRMGELTLTSVATLTMGTVDGKTATTYVNQYDELSDLEDGAISANLIRKKTQKLWYVEGKGICKNGNNKWDAEGENFAPKAGDIKITLDESKLTSLKYDAETETLTAVLKKQDATELLKKYLMEGQEISSGVTISITVSGGRIAAVKLEYTAPEHDISLGEGESAINVTIPESKIVIESHYNYDLAVITLK